MSPPIPLATINRSMILRSHKGNGVFSDLNFILNIFTWLVMEIKVALLEAELKVSLSFYLLASSSPSEFSSKLSLSSSETLRSS